MNDRQSQHVGEFRLRYRQAKTQASCAIHHLQPDLKFANQMGQMGDLRPASHSSDPSEMKDKKLTEFATRFLTAYAASAQGGNGDPAAIKANRPYSLGPGGIVEITDEIAEAQRVFVHRAATLLCTRTGNDAVRPFSSMFILFFLYVRFQYA